MSPCPAPLVVKLTCGAEDPERANQAFTVAAAAAVSGADVSLWLTGDSAWFAVPGRAEVFDLPLATPLADLRGAVLALGRITVCSQCAARRGLEPRPSWWRASPSPGRPSSPRRSWRTASRRSSTEPCVSAPPPRGREPAMTRATTGTAPAALLPAALLVGALLLSACGGTPSGAPTPSSAPTPTPTSRRTPDVAPPCLVSAEQLAEITGTSQEVETSPVPGVELYCETTPDARGIEMFWYLEDPAPRRLPTARQQGRSVRDRGLDVSRLDLGATRPGWLGLGPGDVPNAQVLTVLDGAELHISVLGGDADPADLGEEATALARALVASGRAS